MLPLVYSRPTNAAVPRSWSWPPWRPAPAYSSQPLAVNRFALREELPDLLVDVLDRCLLVALIGVAEKQVGPLRTRLGRKLNSLDVREAWVPVGQDRRKDFAELFIAMRFLQILEHAHHLGRILLLYRKQENKVYLRKD